MGAEKAIGVGVAVVIAVMIAGAMLQIFKQGNGFINKGLSQATDLSAKFNDVDKQKYDGMSCMGDTVQQVIQDYWEDPTCEVVVCTLDGVNAVYNKASDDQTYSVPFEEQISGMPTADCKGRAFPSDTAINRVPTGISKSSFDDGGVTKQAYDVAVIASANINSTTGAASGNAFIVNAAELVQGPGSINKTLATERGYNSLAAVGSGGYISPSAAFVGSIQKDANGAIRRITFVQD